MAKETSYTEIQGSECLPKCSVGGTTCFFVDLLRVTVQRRGPVTEVRGSAGPAQRREVPASTAVGYKKPCACRW